jgi:denticleless
LTTPTPTLLATLNGHTSSVKTTVFFDPTRSHMDASTHSSIVASGGRDGHILIFDLRCQGRSREVSETPSNSSGRSGSSERYSHGISGFAAQTGGDILNPVMAIKGAHGDGSKRSNSVSCPAEQRLIDLNTTLIVSELLYDPSLAW